MKKSWGLIPKILSGEKTVESRWYQTRRAPWDKIQEGDVIFFKNSGELVTAQAMVSHVLQFTLNGLSDVREIVKKYGKEICLLNADPETWDSVPKYCILVRLKNPKPVKAPFAIDKAGFGSAAAWMTVGNIRDIVASR